MATFSSVGTSISSVISAIRGSSDESSKEAASAAASMAKIVSGNHKGALASIKGMVSEVNKLGQDVKISSTIENLALVTAGKSTSITGQRVAANTTNVTANVQNFFEGLQMKLMIDDTTALNAHIASVTQGDKA